MRRRAAYVSPPNRSTVSLTLLQLASAAIGILFSVPSANAQYVWNSGDLSTASIPSNTIGVTELLSISTSSNHDMNGQTLTNNGTVNWQSGAGPIRSGNGGVIANNATWTDNADSAFTNVFGGAASTFNNTGTYNKEGPGTTQFSGSFALVNAGTINLNAGTLDFAGTGSFTGAGSLTAASGTITKFNSDFAIPDASALHTAGATVQLAAGTLTISGAASNLGALQLTAGTLAGTHTFVSDITWSGSSLNGAGTTTFGAASTVTIDVNGNHDFNQRAIVNDGVVNWTDGQLRTGNAGSFTNNGTFNDSASDSANNIFGGAASAFVNSAGATYNKTAAGTTTIASGLVFTNGGTVNVDAGTFQFNGTGSLSGAGLIDADAGTTVTFNSDFSVADGSRLQGLGQYQLTGGTLTLGGTTGAQNFQVSGGTLAGTQTFSNGLTWTAGNLNNTGSTANGAGSIFTIAGGADHDFNSHTITNAGTVEWTGGRLRTGNAGSFTNTGTFNDSASNAINNNYGGAVSAFTNAAGATYNKLSAGTTTVDTGVVFTNAGTVNVDAGTLQFNGTGSLSGAGRIDADAGATVVFNSNFTVPDAAQLQGLGQYTLTAGTLTMEGIATAQDFQIAGGTLTGTQQFTNGVTWTAGNMNAAGAMTNGASSTFTVSGSADHDFNGHAIVSDGTVAWTGGRLRTGNAGSFTNNGTVNDSASSSFNNDYGGASSTFTNSAGATYNKSAAGTTTFGSGVAFNNAGTVNVTAGTLAIAGGGTSAASAAFNVSAGAALSFASGTMTLADGASLAGAGQFAVAGGTLSVSSGTATLSNLAISNGTLSGASNALVSSLTLTGGSAIISSLTLTGASTWTGGNMNGAGTTTNAGGATLDIGGTSDHDLNARTFVNTGTVNWTGGRLRMGNAASLTNNFIFNDSADSTINNDYGGTASTFTNASGASYVKTGAGTTTIAGSVAFANAGTVSVAAGTLQFDGTGSLSGAGRINASAGATVVFNSGFTVPDASLLQGSGQYRLTLGTLNLDGTVNAPDFDISGGSLAGTQTFANGASWSGGNWNTPGTTTIGAASTLTVSGVADHDFNGRAVVNNGNVLWSGGRLRSGSGGSFTNNSLFVDSAASTFNADYSGGAAFFNAAGAVFSKTSAGTTAFDNGFSFDNAGVLEIDAGTLSITTTLTLEATGVIAFGLGGTTAGAGYGTLAATTAVALRGSLELYFNGGFESSILATDTFTILSGNALSGTFANIASGGRLATADGFGSFQVNFGAGSPFAANSVVLSDFQAIPEPSTWALLLTGATTALLVGRFRRRAS